MTKTNKQVYLRVAAAIRAVAVQLQASAAGEAWVRERIQAASPRPSHVDEETYAKKVDEFVAKNDVLVQYASEMLRGRPIPVAALRRAMTVGSSWNVASALPKKEGKRQVAAVQSQNIVLYKEDGGKTYLTLKGASVFQVGDAFYISFDDIVNILKYEPAEFDASEARRAKLEERRAEEAQAAQKKLAQKEAAEAAEAALWDGFLVGLSPLKKGQAKKALDKSININGRIAKVGDHIREMVKERGYRVDGDRLYDAERRSFFDKKALGAMALQYAAFLAASRG